MKRAVVVVDVQNEHVRGELVVTHPSLHVSMPNIALTMDVAAGLGVPTVVVCRVAPAGSAHFAEDAPGSAVHPLIADNPKDAILVATGPTDPALQKLVPWLNEREVDTVTVVGYTADDSLSHLARLVADSGIAVEVLEDATGSHQPADASLDARAVYERALDALQQHSSITIGTTSDWDGAVREERPVARAAVDLSHENETPDPVRERYEELEAADRARHDRHIADAETFQMQHTFTTGVQWV